MGEGRRVVVWTPSARASLDEVLAFIAEASIESAAQVLDVVLAAADSLSLFAERGRVVPEVRDPSIREIFVYRYRVMYQVLHAEIAFWPSFMERWISRAG